MAISHVAVGTSTSTTGVTTLAATLPAGFAANDLFLLWMHWPDAITAQNLPTGWTQLVALTAEGTTSKAALYYRIAQAGDTAPTITWTTSSKPIFHVGAWRGVDTTTPTTGAGITVDTTSTNSTIVGGAVTNTGTGVEWAVVFGAFRTTATADKAGSITGGVSGMTLRTSSNNSGAASSPWAIDGTTDSNGAVTAGSHSYTLGVSGVITATTHKFAANVYLNPAAGAAATARTAPLIVNQAVSRSLTRCSKLTRRRSGLFVPSEWATRIA
jgi:hypothetical protein